MGAAGRRVRRLTAPRRGAASDSLGARSRTDHPLGKQCVLLLICVIRLLLANNDHEHAARARAELIHSHGAGLDQALLESVRIIALEVSTSSCGGADGSNNNNNNSSSSGEDIIAQAMALRSDIASQASNVASPASSWLRDCLLECTSTSIKSCFVSALKSAARTKIRRACCSRWSRVSTTRRSHRCSGDRASTLSYILRTLVA